MSSIEIHGPVKHTIMVTKVAIISALVAVCHGALLVEDNHHAVSSQSIYRHDQPHQLEPHFATPVLAHAPVHGQLVHATPVVHHHAGPVVHTGPVLQHLAIGQTQHVEEEHAPAHYSFSYSVDDNHTGDHKSHRESREGGVVNGEYSVLQSDGSVRKVTYTADDHNGFNAVVHNTAPNAQAAPPQPAHAPVVHALPVLAHH